MWIVYAFLLLVFFSQFFKSWSFQPFIYHRLRRHSLSLCVCLWHQTQKQQLTALSGGVSYSWLGSARNNEVCNWWYHFIIIAVADFIHGSFCGASNRNGVIKFSETEKTRREEKNTNTHINVSQQRIYTLQSVRNNSKPHF